MNGHDQRLGDFFTSRRQRGVPGLPTLSVTLDRGLAPRSSLERKTDTNLTPKEHLRVHRSDIAYNMMRMWQGASGIAHEEALVSPAYIVLAPKESIDPVFAAYLFKSPEMIHRFWAYSYGITNDRLRLYFNDFKRVPVDIPPLPEQRKIADILSTWDRAIETTEALLTTVRAQKRALMQALLTGKRRFPEFEGQEWKTGHLGDVLEITYGKSPKDVIVEAGSYPILGTGGKTGWSESAIADGPAIIIGRKGTIDKPQWVQGPFWAIDTTYHCHTKNGNDLRWVFAWLRSIHLARYNEASGVPSLSRETLRRIPVSIPSPVEQCRIGEAIALADAEEEVISGQIKKLRAEKKALMQQLLTGKRRVKV